MSWEENPVIARWAIQKIQEKMAEGREEGGAFHASEIFQCRRKTVLNRKYKPDNTAEQIMMFAVGFAMQEWFLGHEPDGKEFLGVIFSVDQLVGDNVMEFKTTRMSPEKYPLNDKGKPDNKQPKVPFDVLNMEHWITRTRAYCAVHGINQAHIMVFFLYANELKCYSKRFTDKELAVTRVDIEQQRDELTEMSEAFEKSDIVPSVDTRKGDWECKFCPFLLQHKDWRGCLLELQDRGVTIEQK